MGLWNKIRGAVSAPIKAAGGWLGDRPWWQLAGLAVVGAAVFVLGIMLVSLAPLVAMGASSALAAQAMLAGGGTAMIVGAAGILVAATTLLVKAVSPLVKALRGWLGNPPVLQLGSVALLAGGLFAAAPTAVEEIEVDSATVRVTEAQETEANTAAEETVADNAQVIQAEETEANNAQVVQAEETEANNAQETEADGEAASASGLPDDRSTDSIPTTARGGMVGAFSSF